MSKEETFMYGVISKSNDVQEVVLPPHVFLQFNMCSVWDIIIWFSVPRFLFFKTNFSGSNSLCNAIFCPILHGVIAKQWFNRR
jgi:hypothetical protein